MLSDRCLSCLSVLSVCDAGVLWPNGWMAQDETWHGGRPQPGHIVLDGTQLHPKGGHSSPPSFQHMSTVAKRSPISASAEHLLLHIYRQPRYADGVVITP